MSKTLKQTIEELNKEGLIVSNVIVKVDDFIKIEIINENITLNEIKELALSSATNSCHITFVDGKNLLYLKPGDVL